MRLKTAAIACVVLAGMLASCTTDDVDVDPLGATSPSSSVATQAPLPTTPTTVATTVADMATTAAPTTAPASTTTVPEPTETWVGFQHRAFPGSTIELVEVESGQRILLPLDRRSPWVGRLESDRAGGLMVLGGSPPFAPLHTLAAGATSAVPLLIGDEANLLLEAVVDIDGAPCLLYRTVSWEWDRDETDEWTETQIRLIVHPLDGDPELLAEGQSTWRFAGGRYLTTGSTPEHAGYGSGVLAVLWSVPGEAHRLELRKGLTEAPAEVVVPDFAASADEPVDIVDVAVSADGTVLFTLLFPASDPARGGPDLVAWDLTDGTEIDRLTGTMSFVHDGDRTIAGDRRTQNYEMERFVAHLDDDGFDRYEILNEDSSPLGVITTELRIAAGATLESTLPWPQCSLAQVPDQPSLPQQVSDTRGAIASAAARCDLLALYEVAAADPGFRIADGDEPCEPWLASIDEVDPVYRWYQGTIADDEMKAIIDSLSGPPERDGSRYVWQNEHGYRIEIDESGAWVLDWRLFPREPCESILCTC